MVMDPMSELTMPANGQLSWHTRSHVIRRVLDRFPVVRRVQDAVGGGARSRIK